MIKAFISAREFVVSENAATIVEYGLMIALVALAVAVAAHMVGRRLDRLFDTAANSV
jgi:Flp pilus assembly pilin Flp